MVPVMTGLPVLIKNSNKPTSVRKEVVWSFVRVELERHMKEHGCSLVAEEEEPLGKYAATPMTETLLTISGLHLLTMTCEQCGTGFRFDLSRSVTIPDKCPIRIAKREYADYVRALADALIQLREIEGGPFGISFGIRV